MEGRGTYYVVILNSYKYYKYHNMTPTEIPFSITLLLSKSPSPPSRQPCKQLQKIDFNNERKEDKQGVSLLLLANEVASLRIQTSSVSRIAGEDAARLGMDLQYLGTDQGD